MWRKAIVNPFVLGLLLVAWAIFSIEIPVISKVPSPFSDNTCNGFNRLFLALSYSYLAGAIIYWFTVKYPYRKAKKRIQPIIDAKIKDIGRHLLEMNLEFRETTNPNINQVDKIMELFNNNRWKEKCRMPEHAGCKDVTDAFFQDYRELQRMVGQLINDYKDYLSTSQLLMLECLRGGKIGQFASMSKGSNYYDVFYERVLQPEYRKFLECYNILVSL